MKRGFPEESPESFEMLGCIAERVLNVVTCPLEFGSTGLHLEIGAPREIAGEFRDGELQCQTGVRRFVELELCFDADSAVTDDVGFPIVGLCEAVYNRCDSFYIGGSRAADKTCGVERSQGNLDRTTGDFEGNLSASTGGWEARVGGHRGALRGER